MNDKEGKSIFRKEALKKLYSAEDLEKALYVTRPVNWVFLITILLLSVAFIVWSFIGSISTVVTCQGIYLDLNKFKSVTALANGHIISMNILVGSGIKKGDVLAITWDENEKKEVEIKADYDGFVSDVFLEKGSTVNVDQAIATVQYDIKGGEEDRRFYCFVDAQKGEKIKLGMGAVVYPWGISEEVGGGIIAKVESISYLPASTSYFKSIHLNDAFISHITSSYTLIPLTLKPELKKDSSLKWTSKKGPKDIPLGSILTVHVKVSAKKPINYIFPKLGSDKNL